MTITGGELRGGASDQKSMKMSAYPVGDAVTRWRTGSSERAGLGRRFDAGSMLKMLLGGGQMLVDGSTECRRPD